MANNDFTIKGKIDIDSREYQAFLKSKQALEKNLLKQAEQKTKSHEEYVKSLEKEIKALKEREAADKKDYSSAIKKKQQKLDEIRLQDKINKLQDQYNKAKLEVMKKTEQQSKIEDIKNRAQERNRQRDLSKLAEGPADYGRLSNQIRNWNRGGFFEFLADKESVKGKNILEGLDEKIASSQDTKDLNTIELESLQSSAKRTSTGEIDKRTKDWKRIQELNKSNQQIDANIKNYEKEKAITQGSTKANVGKYQAMAAAAQKVAGQLSAIGKKIGGIILKPFEILKKRVLDAATAMFDFSSGVATFATGTSLITNAAAREQQLKYGLTASQNYGFTKAKEMLNIQSDEDLMYMNRDQRERLLQYMEQYSRWYDEMESSGVLQAIQEMQLEFNELKEELAMEFLSWVAENKDTIMTCIRGIFEVIKWVANMIMSIVNFITGGKANSYDLYDSAKASDTVNNNNNNSRNTTININANTTNNATGVLGSADALNKFNEENWSNLAKQIVGAIGG